MNWTIQRKLYAMVAALSVLLVMLGALTYERFGRTAEIEDELNAAHRIEVLSSEMQRSILEARRREKDFFAVRETRNTGSSLRRRAPRS